MSELKLDRPSGFWEAVGMHPLGTVGGALAGVLLGFVGGVAAGPVGSLLGAVVGGVAGALLGASVETGPEIDLSEHDGFWREHYTERPYVHAEASLDWEAARPAARPAARDAWERLSARVG